MSDDATLSASDGGRSSPEVPEFELIRPIGRGGFGQVWLATNRTTGRLRAVKVIALKRQGTTDPAGREITSLTRLEANVRRQDPNLLNIHHVGKTADHLYYVMDAADDVSGNPASSDVSYEPATLQRRLQAGPLTPDECGRFARQLLQGLASLHAAGMVHRDVKPANCLFVDGELKLADFGLLTEAGPQVSRIGTQDYMPPDGRMDTRADVYAAGLVIYELITGLPADGFPRLGERANQVAEDPGLGALLRVALHACHPDPKERFQDARQMLAELETCELEVTTRPARLRRRVAVSIACLLAVALLAAAGIWAARPPRVHVNFITHPPEATIYLDDTLQVDAEGKPLKTPCTVDNVPARAHRVVFQRQGLPKLDAGQIDFAEARQVVARWPQP